MPPPPRVPFNPFDRQWADIGADVLGAVEAVGRSGWYVLGREVEEFEGAFSAFVGRAHTVGCASGLDAIEIGLRALGLRAGDKVLTTPMSAFATTLAIVRAGGVPVFVDVDATGLLDLDAAEAALAADPGIRFLVPVHLYGHALDLERLLGLRDRFELRIVEDAAQAHGARSGTRAVGSVGQVTAYSFYPTKNLGALGDAGALSTDHPELRDEALSLRNYGQSAKYVHDRLGMNSRLDELHAAILRAACLPRLGAWNERRRQIAERYRAGLDHPDVRALPAPRGSRSVYHLFPVRVPAASRASFLAWLAAEGVQSGIHYPTAIPDQQAMGEAPHVVGGSLERCRGLAHEQVSLPINPYLRDEEIDRVLEVVRRWKPEETR